MNEVSELKERVSSLEAEVKRLDVALDHLAHIVSRYGLAALLANDEEALLENVTDLVQRVDAIEDTLDREK